MQLVRRGAAVAAVCAPLALTAALPASAATGATTTVPAQAAAGWLARQLTGPGHDHFVFAGTTYADDGNTADAVLGMDAAGVAQTAAARATAWLESDATTYAGTAPDFYPGSLAKLLLVAEAQHADVHAFGGLDLVASLRGEETSSGLYQDPDTTNGYQSVVTQALALAALSHTGDPADRPDQQALDWLLGQECGNGGFQNDIRADTSAPCTPDVDTTAFAVQGIVAAGGDPTAALAWLVARRNADGGFGSAAGATSNANSTAVAAQALVAAGRGAASEIAWLADHQQGCSAPAAQRGALRFQSAWDPGTALRATTQGAQALAGKALVQIDDTGAAAAAPTLSCPAATTTTTPARTKATHRVPTRRAVPAADPATATLARTGPAPVAPTAALGTGLALLGAATLVAARRRRSPR